MTPPYRAVRLICSSAATVPVCSFNQRCCTSVGDQPLYPARRGCVTEGVGARRGAARGEFEIGRGGAVAECCLEVAEVPRAQLSIVLERRRRNHRRRDV